MKTKTCFTAAAAITPLALSLSLAAQTMPRSAGLSTTASPIASATAGPAASATKQNPRPFPFHGMVSAVDQKNKTFTISGKEATRVFKVTDKTVITKGAGSAKLTDITDNQEVSGAYWKNTDGSLEAKLIKLGPTEKKSPPRSSPTASAKSQ